MLHNPSNLYSGGQGILRDNVVDYVTALENKKRAKDEALDKYYQNLPATVNEKGVRDQDIPGLHQKIGELQSYWMQNRDAIRKGNTPENFNYQKLFRDIQGGLDMSKNATATSLKLGQARLDPNKAYMFKGDDKNEMLLAHEKPVWDAGHKGIDLSQFESVQPLDTKKHLAPLVKIAPNESEPRYEAIQGDQFNRMEIRDRKYSPDDLSAIYVYSQEQMNNNGGFEKAVESAVQNPETAAQLTDLFQRQYGKVPQSENDLAAAYTLLLKGDTSPKYKKVVNDEAKNQAKIDAATLAFNRRKELARLNDKLIKGRKEDGTVDISKVGYPTNQFDEDYGETISQSFEGMPAGETRVVYADKIPVEALREANPQDINKGILPVKPLIESGTKRPYYKVEKDPNGNVNLVGDKDRKIGAEDARNNFIKENVGTKFKLKVNMDKPEGKESKDGKNKWHKYLVK